jgi:flagellar biosynthesis protein FlhB
LHFGISLDIRTFNFTDDRHGSCLENVSGQLKNDNTTDKLMWTTIKNNYKNILTTVGLFLVGFLVAYVFEDYYRQLVRFSFKFFNGDSIQFVGKNFRLFASDRFVTAFGLFASLTFLLLKFSIGITRLERIFVTVIIFFLTTILITALDSKRLIIECTACDNGIRRLAFNSITYDKYFIISLTAAIAYLLTAYLLEKKRIKKTNEKA